MLFKLGTFAISVNHFFFSYLFLKDIYLSISLLNIMNIFFGMVFLISGILCLLSIFSNKILNYIIYHNGWKHYFNF